MSMLDSLKLSESDSSQKQESILQQNTSSVVDNTTNGSTNIVKSKKKSASVPKKGVELYELCKKLITNNVPATYPLNWLPLPEFISLAENYGNLITINHANQISLRPVISHLRLLDDKADSALIHVKNYILEKPVLFERKKRTNLKILFCFSALDDATSL